MTKAVKIPDWLAMSDGGVRCTRCGKGEKMPLPMPITAFGPWCQYQGALHRDCKDTGRVDVPPASVAEWITGHDTGTSSKAIYRHMAGLSRDVGVSAFGNYPHDPDDFGRCYRLLQLAPNWSNRIGEMSVYGPEWAALAAAWGELTAMYEEVLERGRKSAPELYERMKELESLRASAKAAE